MKNKNEVENLLGGDLENVVISEVGLDRAFESDPIEGFWIGLRLFLDIHSRGFHVALLLCLLSVPKFS